MASERHTQVQVPADICGSRPRCLMKYAILLAVSLVSTLSLYLALYRLASGAIDPVTWASPSSVEQEYRQHGKPILSVSGIAIWSGVVVMYTAIIVFVSHGVAVLPPRPAMSVLILSLVIITVVHPLLSPLLMPHGWRSNYVAFFERMRLPFGPSQRTFELSRLLLSAALPHAVLVYLVLLVSLHGRRPFLGSGLTRRTNFR